MEIYFVNICIEWLYKLYNEYIDNLLIFIKNNFNINVKTILIDPNFNYLDIFDKIYNSNNKYIFCGNYIAINKIFDKYDFSKKFYYLNIEQMSHHSYFKEINLLNQDFKIIDYSEENIPFIKNIFSDVFLLPPIYENENILFNDKNIDIISFSNNEYRKNYLNNIKNFNINCIDNIFGEERDNIFRRSKIYINIHSSTNHNTMELIRVINLLKKKVIVLTQNSVNINLLYLKESLIIFENQEQLEYLLKDILNNYESYYNYIFNNINLKYYDNYLYKNIKILLDD